MGLVFTINSNKVTSRIKYEQDGITTTQITERLFWSTNTWIGIIILTVTIILIGFWAFLNQTTETVGLDSKA